MVSLLIPFDTEDGIFKGCSKASGKEPSQYWVYGAM
jgi:hypothetical protein